MEQVVDSILHKLTGKGLIIAEIPRLIKDVLNIVRDETHSSAVDVNRRLKGLSWEEDILDGYTFELILFLLEQRGTHDIRVQTLH